MTRLWAVALFAMLVTSGRALACTDAGPADGGGPWGPPTPPPGCTVVEADGGCGWQVICPPPPRMDAGAAPVCSTDGAVPRACTTDADCEGAPHLGAGPLVCNASRVCDCAPPPSRSAGGCAIGARHAAPGSPWALGAVLALRRRRRRT